MKFASNTLNVFLEVIWCITAAVTDFSFWYSPLWGSTDIRLSLGIIRSPSFEITIG